MVRRIAVCSASRAALLTGCHPPSVNVPGNVSATDEVGLDRDVTTLPQALKKLGYQTAMSGKWHLGHGEQSQPHNRGFDDWFGFLFGCIDYYSHIFYWAMGRGDAPGARQPTHDLWDNGKQVFRNGEYATDLFAERAVQQLRRAKDDGRPFFLYVPWNAPHYPMHAPAQWMDRFAHLDRERQTMAALLGSMDAGVGRVLDELDALELSDNTCVLFTGDHGPSREPRNREDGLSEPYHGGSTAGLRGHKFQVYEGGIRVPGIMRWPGVITPGSVSHEPVTHIDVFPTFINAAGDNANALRFHGLDIGQVLRGGPSPHAKGDMAWTLGDACAYRRGKDKLVIHGRGDDATVELFDLDADPNESTDLSTTQRDLTTTLHAAAQSHRQSAGA